MSDTITLPEVLKLIEEGVRRSGARKKFGKEIGISGQAVCDLLNGTKRPGPKTLTALGIGHLQIVGPEMDPAPFRGSAKRAAPAVGVKPRLCSICRKQHTPRSRFIFTCNSCRDPSVRK